MVDAKPSFIRYLVNWTYVGSEFALLDSSVNQILKSLNLGLDSDVTSKFELAHFLRDCIQAGKYIS